MCGISGIIQKSNNNFFLKKNIKKMIFSLKHRGPDSQNYWNDYSNNIALGHTRLSIQDLSINGSQPMISSNKRFVIVFNGEIYNHHKLRKNYFTSRKKWKSKSDTETLIEFIQKFGIDETLKHLSGMFAFAVFDRSKKKLYLVRDLHGEKPLYYGWNNQDFIFSSELGAITSIEKFKAPLNYSAVAEFLKRSYIPTPYSIFENLYKLQPGHYVEVILPEIKKGFLNKTKKREKFKIVNWKKKTSFNENFKNPEKKIINLLEESVKEQLISDAPIGCFLSGGVDSSLIASIANKNLKKIKTFSLIVNDRSYNEKKFSDEVSKKLKTSHHRITMKKNEILNTIKNISNFYSEPFADSSQIPTLILSKYTSKYVKVVLTGDAADEFFGGYNRYFRLKKIWNISNFFPRFFTKLTFKILNKVPIFLIKKIENFFYLLNISSNYTSQFSDKYQKIVNSFSVSNTFFEFFENVTLEKWVDDYVNLKRKKFRNNYIEKSIIKKNKSNFNLSDIIVLGKRVNLPDDMLCKIDRASMAFGLETRVPFLDKKLTSYMDKLPKKYHHLIENKKILKKTLDKYIYKGFSERPKMGFSIPLDSYLKKELKNFMLETLSKEKIDRYNIISWKIVQRKIDEHLNSIKNNGRFLWSLIVLVSWIKKNEKKVQF